MFYKKFYVHENKWFVYEPNGEPCADFNYEADAQHLVDLLNRQVVVI
jgi:hypothetical protein